MKCSLCKVGETAPGVVTVTLERNGSKVLIKDVPAQVCTNCGEYYLDETVTAQVMAMAMRAAEARSELQVIRYAA